MMPLLAASGVVVASVGSLLFQLGDVPPVDVAAKLFGWGLTTLGLAILAFAVTGAIA